MARRPSAAGSASRSSRTRSPRRSASPSSTSCTAKACPARAASWTSAWPSTSSARPGRGSTTAGHAWVTDARRRRSSWARTATSGTASRLRSAPRSPRSRCPWRASPRPTDVAGRRAPGARRTSVAERRERRAAGEDPAIVLDAAAAFLAVRPRSIGETRRRLQSLGYRAVLIDHVIGRLLAYGYLDDAAFGRAWLESRDRARPRGSHALRSELLAKGLERDLIASWLAEGADSSAPGDGAEPAMAAGDPDVAAAERLLTRRRAALMREPDP